jgi:hypothetical protein
VNWQPLARWWTGDSELGAIESIDLSLAAPWAGDHAGLIAGLCAAIAMLAAWSYARQRAGRGRTALAIARGGLLVLLVLILAEPTAVITSTRARPPVVWLLFDTSESMSLRDEWPAAQRRGLEQAVGWNRAGRADGAGPPGPSSLESTGARPTRLDYLRRWLERADGNAIDPWNDRFRLRAFSFDGTDSVVALEPTTGVEPAARDVSLRLDPSDSADASNAEQRLDPQALSGRLSATGQVTALGSALRDLARRHSGAKPAALVIFSDFNQNAGPSAVPAALALGVPIHAVGLGPESAPDVALELTAPPVMKQAERAMIAVSVRQTGFDGARVTVRLEAEYTGGAHPAKAPAEVLEERAIDLTASTSTIEFPLVPDESGPLVLRASIEPLPGEVVTDNNSARREIVVRDDFLRLLFVEYEPTWEWRFIKEVFHRDKLVGERGFRTFLRSADPSVRRRNELFLDTAAPPRAEFFANDVIVLGDMPAEALSDRFCQMTREFVGDFGGGLVILSGPRFGPGQLAGTPLADLLPVVVESESRPRDAAPFLLAPTAEGRLTDFMRLGIDDAESDQAWANLGPLPWYQPVARLHPLASTALAVHPTDTCADGRSPQPLIAMRRYGRGEVVFLGFNETWRLRRQHGERYYRQFWGQLIHRLGLSHAPGAQKRFIVRTDRPRYQPDEQAVLTVEAYDSDFQPLSAATLPQGALFAEWTTTAAASADAPTRLLGVRPSRDGLFEATLPNLTGGEHRVRVKDPVTGEQHEARFQVARVSAERRQAERNAALALELAEVTGGQAYDLASIDRLVANLDPPRPVETSTSSTPLIFHPWLAWPCFLLIVALMLGEWLGRRWMNLP